MISVKRIVRRRREMPERLCRSAKNDFERVASLGSLGSATTVDGALTPDDLDNIALCKKVDGSTWFRIHEWGKRTGMLKDWETGIAHTLSAYAASGWDRGPSPKQAMHGARIFKLAEQDSVMSETTGFEAE